MSRTITVKGIGKISAKPDYVVLSLSLKSHDTDYGKAMELADKELGQLKEALGGAGFDKKALKTADFNVRADYNSVNDRSGNYRREFNGYTVSHSLKLEFDFDSARLSKALSAVSDCLSNPELSVAFTVKDVSFVNERLLRAAAENAKHRAKVLCAASDVELGALLSVSYSWSEADILSNTAYRMSEECFAAPMARSAAVDIEPDDISVSDTAVFVWEIK
ncbi:MAG: SIMPL domain-containing protein [Butyrivibrio sp.]|nr:SIMPL domain-containing protein [Butyrivibrio sp.]